MTLSCSAMHYFRRDLKTIFEGQRCDWLSMRFYHRVENKSYFFDELSYAKLHASLCQREFITEVDLNKSDSKKLKDFLK